MRRGVHREIEDQREQEVRRGTRECDRSFLARRLLEKAAAAILRRELLEGIVAGELHVPAEGQERHAVFGLAPLDSEQARTESDREPHRLDAEPLANQEVPQLVEEDDDADEDRERNQRQAGRVQVRDHSS